MSENALRPAWQALRRPGHAALVAYLTAGFPDRRTSLAALRSAARIADILEVGVPFSDPVADGPVIQRASFDALAAGMTLRGTLDLIAEAELTCPVVLFSYLNPLLRYGIERLTADAEAAGVEGLLVTDLPSGADPAIESTIRASRLDLIPLVAPTTPAARLETIDAEATGFLYLIGRLGVTGPSSTAGEGLPAVVGRVRARARRPIAVGFGIGTAAQVRAAARVADGVVVGSALVGALGTGGVGALEAVLAELAPACVQSGAMGAACV
ncbi:MAG TPA: tryptophan synthase subunit alpha [Gemmatimonadales bacterium]|nr:tryptophan synthase subunit alpha [Gemmatimonadales bacterium]